MKKKPDDLRLSDEQEQEWKANRQGATKAAINLAMAATLRMRELLYSRANLDPWDACAVILNDLEKGFDDAK